MPHPLQDGPRPLGTGTGEHPGETASATEAAMRAADQAAAKLDEEATGMWVGPTGARPIGTGTG